LLCPGVATSEVAKSLCNETDCRVCMVALKEEERRAVMAGSGSARVVWSDVWRERRAGTVGTAESTAERYEERVGEWSE